MKGGNGMDIHAYLERILILQDGKYHMIKLDSINQLYDDYAIFDLDSDNKLKIKVNWLLKAELRERTGKEVSDFKREIMKNAIVAMEKSEEETLLVELTKDNCAIGEGLELPYFTDIAVSWDLTQLI